MATVLAEVRTSKVSGFRRRNLGLTMHPEFESPRAMMIHASGRIVPV